MDKNTHEIWTVILMKYGNMDRNIQEIWTGILRKYGQEYIGNMDRNTHITLLNCPLSSGKSLC